MNNLRVTDLSLLHTDVLKEMIAAGTELLLSDITNSYNKVMIFPS